MVRLAHLYNIRSFWYIILFVVSICHTRIFGELQRVLTLLQTRFWRKRLLHLLKKGLTTLVAYFLKKNKDKNDVDTKMRKKLKKSTIGPDWLWQLNFWSVIQFAISNFKEIIIIIYRDIILPTFKKIKYIWGFSSELLSIWWFFTQKLNVSKLTYKGPYSSIL